MPVSRSVPSSAERGPRRWRALEIVVLIAALFGISGLDRVAPSASASSQAARQAIAPSYDLQADERIGGHTIARHVGKSDQELSDRLQREPRISAASTYPDLETARRVVAAAIEQSRDRVDLWARRSGMRPNLTLNYQSSGRPIGRSLSRGARVSAVATRALVVLRWHERQRRWYVLTSYPEARR
jgi:hypothetical protein